VIPAWTATGDEVLDNEVLDTLAGKRNQPMRIQKPDSAATDGSQKICPVCGQRSYSAGGTHPQCAQRRADAAQKEKMDREKISTEEQTPQKALPPQQAWKKKCPKCDAVLHIRKKTCSCGHRFPGC